MITFAFLTRKTEDGKTDWVAAAQEDGNPKMESSMRYIVWGEGQKNIKGSSAMKTDTILAEYLFNRTSNGYKVKIKMDLYITSQELISMAFKYAMEVMDLVDQKTQSKKHSWQDILREAIDKEEAEEDKEDDAETEEEIKIDTEWFIRHMGKMGIHNCS